MKNIGSLKNNLGFCEVPEILIVWSLYPKDSHHYIYMLLPSPVHYRYLLTISSSSGLLGWMIRFTRSVFVLSPPLELLSMALTQRKPRQLLRIQGVGALGGLNVSSVTFSLSGLNMWLTCLKLQLPHLKK